MIVNNLRTATLGSILFFACVIGLPGASIDDDLSRLDTEGSPTLMRQLIADSMRGEMLCYSKALWDNHVAEADVLKFKDYIEKHDDYSSYHLLFALYRDCPRAYKDIPVAVRAAILCSALANWHYYNDWGDLDMDPNDILSDPGEMLLEIGSPAIPYLVPLLDDRQEAKLEGSEEATISSDCEYRRADWACLYLSLILKVPYHFSESPTKRDEGITALKQRLAKPER